MKSLFVYGRGEIATRLETLLKSKYPIVDSIEISDVYFLAQDTERCKQFIESHWNSINKKIIFDFSGYSKLSEQKGTYALNKLLFEGAELKNSGIISLPACYSSSIIIPLNYISKRFGLDFLDLKVVSIGGKSTLGRRKTLENNSLRLASVDGHSYHVNEVKENLYCKPSYLDMNIYVGDFSDGIISTIYADNYVQQSTMDIDELNDIEITFDWDSNKFISRSIQKTDSYLPSQGKSNFSFIIKKSLSGNGIIIYSYVNNIDLPINIAYSWLNRINGESR